jgi:hypothetical protein
MVQLTYQTLRKFFHWHYSGVFILVLFGTGLAMWIYHKFSAAHLFISVAGVWAIFYWQFSDFMIERRKNWLKSEDKSSAKPNSIPEHQTPVASEREYLKWNILITALIVVSVLACLSAMRQDQRQSEQSDVHDRLSAEISLPASKANLDSTFTIRSNGHHEIGKHSLFCRIVLGVAPHTEISNNSIAYDAETDNPLEPGGDAESQSCIKNASVKFMVGPDTFLSCMDVIVGIQYSLTSQPDANKEKEFRFVSESDRGYVWSQQPLSLKQSPCESSRFSVQ